MVVTFTNAAASEMRERVLEAIDKKLLQDSDNQMLQRQITLLNKASICTIDSFCLEVVKNYFYELENVSPNFRIGDTTEIEILKQEVLEELFEKKYEEDDEDFIKLLNVYTTYKDDTPLKELILKIDNNMQSNPFPRKWLDEKIEMYKLQQGIETDFSKTPWGEVLLQEVEEEIIDAVTSLQKAKEKLIFEPELETFFQTIQNDINMLQKLKSHVSSWEESYQIYQNFNFVTWPRQKVNSIQKDEAKKIRDDVKKKLQKRLDKILIYSSMQANQDILDMYEILKKLKNIILEYEKEFERKKRERNIVDFSDIEHFALSILCHQTTDGKIEKTEIAKFYEEKFEEIAIDEYQDSNLVQEYILNSISRGNNIFMVGDVKQSIYKFRQAMPELFLSKYASYPLKERQNGNKNLKIQLFKNFRSRENVLQITNIVFENIMSNLLGDIEYNQEEYLNLGAQYEESKQDLKTEIDIIDLAEVEAEKQEQSEEEIEDEQIEERVEDIEVEARFVAKRIQQLVKEKFQVWDIKQNRYRDIKYKDIVVLLRATAQAAPIYEQEILKLEMPVFSDSSQTYLDSIEIQTILCLLKIIDNPMQDIPLVTVLRSSIGGFTDDDLVEIRLNDKHDNFYNCLKKAKVNTNSKLMNKIEKFLNQIEKWRKEQEYLSLDELIWKIYSDTSYYNYVGLMPNGELRQANLKMLFERARQYEKASFKGLYNFIHFIEKLQLSSGDMGAAKIIGENEDVIRIMSIHKSKGLEFPVVILAGTGKQFNLMDLNESILLHQQLGIGVKYKDDELQIQYDTLTKEAIKNKIKIETLSEEMRILYVALTRAKEKLIITGMIREYQKSIEKMQEQVSRYSKNDGKIEPILVKKYRKYIDWFMLVYLYEQNSIDKILTWNVYNKKDVITNTISDKRKDRNILGELEKKEIQVKNIDDIKDMLQYEYPYLLSTLIPTKASVTQLKKLNLKEQKQVNITFVKPKFLKTQEEKLTNAQKGTLVHLCMQHLKENVKYNLEKVNELINELVNNEIITHNESKNINPYSILKFTQSYIWEQLQNAKEISKEKAFYIQIPAKDVYKEDVKENILVQGIIDLYYIDKYGELVLVDYKTDYVKNGNEQDLVNKYQKQLELYKQALEYSIHRRVDKIYIYSTYLGKEIEMKL